MSSLIGTFYNELSARLLGIVDANNKPVIKHIDFWNQQYNDDYKEVFEHPAVFIEIKQMPTLSSGRHKQIAEMQFSLHVASTTKAKSAHGNQFASKFLQHFELLDAIHYRLAGYNGTNFSSISRTNVSIDNYYSDVVKHILTFRCVINDTTAMKTYTKIEGDLLVIELPTE